MKLHKEGFKIIIVSFILLAIFVIIIFNSSTNFPSIVWTFAISSAIFWLMIISFFRYPIFEVLNDENKVISPADGKVVVIETTRVTEFLNEERVQVSIFMSPTDTHMNRYPIDGLIKYEKHHRGKHLVAWKPKSSIDNEHTTVLIENERFSVLVRQIAGAMARRIICYAKVGDEVKQGQQLGFIKFGSRVDLFLPLDAKIEVEINQVVKAGKTIIASI
ncbi:MAG: phosphatidylserine decarboxylase [Bacteroidetes bacterium CG2_30_33_31]|nr:MAG: phosphatidylserine decarboxylase [Bacteroidetes bacterium CG2_30_33_31]